MADVDNVEQVLNRISQYVAYDYERKQRTEVEAIQAYLGRLTRDRANWTAEMRNSFARMSHMPETELRQYITVGNDAVIQDMMMNNDLVLPEQQRLPLPDKHDFDPPAVGSRRKRPRLMCKICNKVAVYEDTETKQLVCEQQECMKTLMNATCLHES